MFQRIISSVHLPTGRAIQKLLQHGVIKCHDLLGIEHLVSAKLSQQALEDRRSYLETVMGAQDELRRTGMGVADARQLGAIAVAASVVSVEKARQKATLALEMCD